MGDFTKVSGTDFSGFGSDEDVVPDSATGGGGTVLERVERLERNLANRPGGVYDRRVDEESAPERSVTGRSADFIDEGLRDAVVGDSSFLVAAEDYSAQVLAEIGTSTQQQPVAFYALGGYTLSKAGYEIESDFEGGGAMFPAADNMIRSGYISSGIKTGVLVNRQWYNSIDSRTTWRGLEMRPFFYAGGAGLVDRLDDQYRRGSTTIRFSDSAEINPANIYRDQDVATGFSGREDLGTTGLRGTYDDTIAELQQLTGTVGLTAFMSNQYSGTDYGATMYGATPMSTAVVVGHLGFGADPKFAGESIIQGTFLWGEEGKLPRGPGPSSEAWSDSAFNTGLDQTAFSDNTYYVCDSSPFFYNTDESQVLRTKFGYDAMTFSDHPYIGTRERIHQGISEIILDIEEDVLVRVDVTKFVNGGNATEIKINRIEASELAEVATFSPSGTGMSGPSNSSDPGGGTYGY